LLSAVPVSLRQKGPAEVVVRLPEIRLQTDRLPKRLDGLVMLVFIAPNASPRLFCELASPAAKLRVA
jgi:hypothetical protein